MVIDVRLLHCVKALAPMDVTLSGMVTEVRLLQPLNVSALMEVMLPGMVMDVRLVQPRKAPSPFSRSPASQCSFSHTSSLFFPFSIPHNARDRKNVTN